MTQRKRKWELKKRGGVVANWQRYGRDKWSVGETHSITFGETLRERWWTFYICMYDKQWEQKNNGDNGDDHEELNGKAGRFVKKRKSSEEKKLPFLLTRFIRKENLDKRGCKITEIVERHKIKADPIFGDQFISGMNCVNVFCSPQYMTFDPLQLFNINQTW